MKNLKRYRVLVECPTRTSYAIVEAEDTADAEAQAHRENPDATRAVVCHEQPPLPPLPPHPSP